MTQRPPLNDVRRVVCVYAGRIGDVIVSTPLLRALRARFPRAHILFIAAQRSAQVLPMLPFVDDCILIGKPQNISAHAALAWRIITRPCDLLIDLNSSFSKTSTLIARVVRARTRLAFDKGRGPQVFDWTLAAPVENEHMSSRYARMAAALEAPYSPELELRVPDFAAVEAARLLPAAFAAPGGGLKIIVHPGNVTRPPAFWPADRLKTICARLQVEYAARLLFIAGPGESDVVRSIAMALPRPAPILPAATLPVVGAALQGADLFLGSLTSTTHLAAALGVATFSFYEGYTQTVWRPRGARHGGTVSPLWSGVADTTVEEAWGALQEHLARIQKPG